MDDIEERCEDNLTDSDSTPVLPCKSFILPNTSNTQSPSSALGGASQSNPSQSDSAPSSLRSSTSNSSQFPPSSSSSSFSSATATSESIKGVQLDTAPPSNKYSQLQGKDNSEATSPSSFTGGVTAQGKTGEDENAANLIGSLPGHSKKMASPLAAAATSSSASSSSNSSSATTPGATNLIGSYNNPKYRIAPSLSSSIPPNSSLSSASAPYKRMPHLHKLEK